jgi:hypothetical protein
MSKRPAAITQADVTRIVRGAQKAGAIHIEVCVGNQAKVIIRLPSSLASGETISQDDIVL